MRERSETYVSENHDLVSLGQVYENWGQYAKAVEYHEKSLEIARKIGDVRSEGLTLGNLGLVFEAWGQYAKAEEYFEKSLEITRKIEDLQNEGHALDHLADVYHALGKDDRALSTFQQELEIYSKIGVPVAGVKDSMGNLYLDMGDVKNAEPLLKEGSFLSSLGRLQLVKSDYQGAQKYYERVRHVTEKNRDVDGLFIAYTGLGTAYEGMGDDKKAEDCFEKAVNLTEDLRSSLPMSQRETFFDVRIGGFLRTAPYDGLARVRIKLNKPLEAFKDSEYTKSRVFAEAMARWSDKTDFNIPADVLKTDKELNDQLAALKKKRQEAYEKANQEVISVIEPQVQEMEDQLQAHIMMLREKYPLFAATKYPEPMDLSETGLRENEWVLTYHVTDPGIIIYLTKGKEIVKALYKPIPRGDLDGLILKMRKPLEIVPGRDNFEKKLQSFDLVTGKKLSDLLLSDMLRYLPPHIPLLVVPDGSLGIFPLEMLVPEQQRYNKDGQKPSLHFWCRIFRRPKSTFLLPVRDGTHVVQDLCEEQRFSGRFASHGRPGLPGKGRPSGTGSRNERAPGSPCIAVQAFEPHGGRGEQTHGRFELPEAASYKKARQSVGCDVQRGFSRVHGICRK